MIRTVGWPLVITTASIVTLLAFAANTGSPVRVAVTFVFFLICPGAAFVRLLRLDDLLTDLTLSVALSIVLGTLVAEALVYLQAWSTERGLLALIGLCLTGVALQVIQAFRRRPQAPA